MTTARLAVTAAMDKLSRRQVIAGTAAVSAAFATEATAGTTGDAVAPRLPKIGLEEHCMFPDLLGYFAETKVNIKPELFARAAPALMDFGERRLMQMDAHGVDFVVLSIAGPGVQVEKDTATAVRIALASNDRLATEVQRQPHRYGGFAHLPMQDPKAAAAELERCVRTLGFAGAMINGATNGIYLDDRRYDVFWERAAALKVPVYIHPANPFDKPAMYADHPELWGPTWSWAVETCTHAMRLLFSGVFDRYPAARIILGHMGETLPIQLWRLDSRYPISNQQYVINRRPSDYCGQNILITTAGVCSDPALRCALDAFGPANVMFSIDYPFENAKLACDWIEQSAISDAERQAVAHGNARSILKLNV